MKLHILAGDTSVYVETKKTGHNDQHQRRVKQLITRRLHSHYKHDSPFIVTLFTNCTKSKKHYSNFQKTT
ncbi:hypothetical protein ACFQZ1_12175 [Bacillus sp. CGMCC 1.60114]